MALSASEIEALIHKANTKYKVIIYLILEAKLRVTQVIQLKIEDFNFQERQLTINNHKIQLSTQAILILTQYWETLTHKEKTDYLFPASNQSQQAHLSRKVVYKRLANYSKGTITPSKLLQFARTNTFPLEHKQREHKPKFQWPKLQKPKQLIPEESKVAITPLPNGTIHIGRTKEIETLNELAHKKVNTLILGPQGIGKSHLLDNYNIGNIIRVDDFRYPKRVLGGLLVELFDGDKQSAMEMLLRVNNKEHLQRIATRESGKRLCELAMQITQPQEYTIVIDDLTDITKVGIRILEKLKNHFHIIAAARKLKLDFANCFSNFQKIELQAFTRSESLELIHRLSLTILNKIEDYTTYQKRIYENTQGNPLYLKEQIERLAKEPYITIEKLDELSHTTSKQEIDFSVPLIIAFASLLVLRYLGNELGQNAGAFRLLGGIALVFAIFSRRLFKALGRKYI